MDDNSEARLAKELSTIGAIRLLGFLATHISAIEHEFSAIVSDSGDTRQNVRNLANQFKTIGQSRWLNELGVLISKLCGRDVSLLSAEGNVMVGDTTWHSDGVPPKGFLFKANIYFDQLDGNSGALCVVRGTHVARREPPYQPEDVVCLSTSPGDVVVFDMGVMHGAFNGTRRRLLSVVFVANPSTDVERDCLVRYLLMSKSIL